MGVHLRCVDFRDFYLQILLLLLFKGMPPPSPSLIIYLFSFTLCIGVLPVCVYGGGGVSDPLEVELQRVVSCHMGASGLNLAPPKDQPVLLTTKLSV